MRGNPNFRDPAWRERALRARNNGGGTAHASWNRLAETRRQAERIAEAELDWFDKWLVTVAHRVQEGSNALSHAMFLIREQEIDPLADSNEIPF
jgi:hypothetical protein